MTRKLRDATGKCRGRVFQLRYSQVALMVKNPPINGKEPAYKCRRHKRCRFDPWIGKIPWRRTWQPTPVFFPGESPWTEEPGGLQSLGSQRVRHE